MSWQRVKISVDFKIMLKKSWAIYFREFQEDVKKDEKK